MRAVYLVILLIVISACMQQNTAGGATKTLDTKGSQKATLQDLYKNQAHKGYIVEYDQESLIDYAAHNDQDKVQQRKKDMGIQTSTAQNEIMKRLGKDASSFQALKRHEFKNVINGVALDISDQEAEKLKDLPGVKSISPNNEVHATMDNSPSLTGAATYWTLDATGNNCASSGKTCLTGKNVTIAIIDTGVDYRHSDLGGGCFGPGCKVIGGFDYVNYDSDPIDDNGHGTHVASIAAGNGVLKGIAPDASIVAYKALNANGQGYLSDIMAALEDATDPNHDGNFNDHYDVASLSLAGLSDLNAPLDSPLTKAVDTAVDAGIVVVVAAGNEGAGQELGHILYLQPANSRKAITVGAIDDNNVVASFSSKGPVIWGKYILKPDIVAPGVDICAAKMPTTNIAGTDCVDAAHFRISGTSMATPHVAGAAALLKQRNPKLSPLQIKKILMLSANDQVTATSGGLALYDTQGPGRLNLAKAFSVSFVGDANGDGKLSIGDAFIAQLQALGSINLSGWQLDNADVNGDGRVNGLDSLLISQYSAGSITKWPKTDGSVLLLGDANLDGKVTIGDALRAQLHINGNTLLGRALDNADVDGDGKISSADVSLIASFSGGAVKKFPRQTTLTLTVAPGTIFFDKTLMFSSGFCGDLTMWCPTYPSRQTNTTLLVEKSNPMIMPAQATRVLTVSNALPYSLVSLSCIGPQGSCSTSDPICVTNATGGCTVTFTDVRPIGMYTEWVTAANVNSNFEIYRTVKTYYYSPPTFVPIGNKQVSPGQTLTFVVTAIDPENDPLIYAASNLPFGATLNPVTGTFNWTPTSNQSGSYYILFTAYDGSGQAVAGTTITVGSTNRPPTLNPIGNKLTTEGQTITFTISGVDLDNDPLTYSAANLPYGATFNATTRTFAWTPAFGAAGNYSNILFVVSDGQAQASEAITIIVGANRPPTLNPIGNKQINTAQTLTFTVTGSDPDNNPLVYSVSNLPIGATFNVFTRTFNWTPTTNQSGSYNVVFTVSDGNTQASEVITITVGAVNHPPVLSPIGNRQAVIGQAITFMISGSDQDGDVLTYSAINLAAGQTFNPATRTFNWTPNQTGNWYVLFIVSDGNVETNELITITVLNANRPPTLNPIGNKQASEGQTLSFTVIASDPDGNPLTYTASNLPFGASFNNATHVFTWTPALGSAGNYSNILFAVSDGQAQASEAITITVTNVNRPPTLSPIGNKQVSEQQTLIFNILASDPDGNPLTYSASNVPIGASFNVLTHVFSWTPGVGTSGNYSNVFFTVSDGQTQASEAITITVTNVNRAPVLNPIGNKQASEGQTLSFTVTASDPDGNPLTYTASNLPFGASFNASTHVFTWTPAFGTAGNYPNVVFIVSDGQMQVSEAITIAVGSVNRPPVLNPIGNKQTNINQTLTFTISGSDPDNNPLVYSASNLPFGATFNSNTRTFNWTPTLNGTYSNVFFMVSDGAAQANEAITISVY